MVILTAVERQQNSEEQRNEVELLESMFDSDVVTSDDIVTVTITSKYFLLVLRCLYHEHYPSHEAPIFTIIDMTSSEASHFLDVSLLETRCSKVFSAGDCVVYQWVGYVKEYLESLDVFVDENSSDEIVLEAPATENDELIADMENLNMIETQFDLAELESTFSNTCDVPVPVIMSKIFTGEILTERKSHFQAQVEKYIKFLRAEILA